LTLTEEEMKIVEVMASAGAFPFPKRDKGFVSETGIDSAIVL